MKVFELDLYIFIILSVIFLIVLYISHKIAEEQEKIEDAEKHIDEYDDKYGT